MNRPDAALWAAFAALVTSDVSHRERVDDKSEAIHQFQVHAHVHSLTCGRFYVWGATPRRFVGSYSSRFFISEKATPASFLLNIVKASVLAFPSPIFFS